MMPLRKMRSRSLAVVELVLSLSVSRAWCMANTQKIEEEKVYFYENLLPVQPPLVGNIMRSLPGRQNRMSEPINSSGTFTEWTREEEGETRWGLPHIVSQAISPVSVTLLISLSDATVSFSHNSQLPLSPTYVFIHTHTHTHTHVTALQHNNNTAAKAAENKHFDIFHSARLHQTTAGWTQFSIVKFWHACTFPWKIKQGSLLKRKKQSISRFAAASTIQWPSERVPCGSGASHQSNNMNH